MMDYSKLSKKELVEIANRYSNDISGAITDTEYYIEKENGTFKGTKGDYYTKKLLRKIIDDPKSSKDINPRPHYIDSYVGAEYDEERRVLILKDGEELKLEDNQEIKKFSRRIDVLTPAHTISINNPGLIQYDLSKGESPMITLRPIAVGASIAEILWIYQKESTDLVEFDELLGKRTWDDSKPASENEINNWWKDWALTDSEGNYLLNEKGHPYIGSTYGEIVRKYKLVETKLKEMKDNPDSRYHIISLWQYEMFEHPHGLKPCAFQTMWNIRHGSDGQDYLDMKLVQRSSDFATAGCINQIQYTVLLILFARHLGIEPGVFTWDPSNIQIYDRHIKQVEEILKREPVECNPKIVIKSKSTNFYDVKPEDIKIVDLPRAEIKELNPQLKFPLGI